MQLRGDRPTGPHWLWSKGKLSEVYITVLYNRIARHEMDEAKKAQPDLRESLPQDLIQALAKKLKKGERLGKVFFAPVNMVGSRRYMQQAYADGMAIIRAKGNPHL